MTRLTVPQPEVAWFIFELNGKLCISFVDLYRLITGLLPNVWRSNVAVLCELQAAHSEIPDTLRDNGPQFMNDSLSNYF